jgi:D-beta-D-heptose 7-phosphate kinase/D-beta-D-heptose 1-phosphate adenosyltransferase
MKVFYGESFQYKSDRCIWTNGCYDILHIGHFRLIEKCRTMAKEHNCPLFVGIDSDKRVRELKGESRPINSEDIRAESLLSIRGVDRVFVYDTAEELQNLIQTVSPHAIVIGEEYKSKQVIGSEYASVVFFPKIEGYSTTKLQQLDKQT